MDVRRPTGEELYEKYRNIALRQNIEMDSWLHISVTDRDMWVNLAELVLVKDE